MNINDFLDNKFGQYPKTDELADLRESIEEDMNNFVQQKVASGHTEEEAVAIAIENARDLDQLLKFIGEQEVDYSKSFNLYSQINRRLNSLELVNSYSVELQNISELHLNFHLGNILILPTTDNKLTVREFMSREIKGLFSTPSKVGNVLQIEQGPRKIVGILRNRIEISLPQSFAGFFSLTSSTGNVIVTKLHSDILFDLTINSGNIRLTDLDVKRIQVDAKSGNLKAQHIKTTDFHINGKSGNVRLQDVHVQGTANQFVITMKSGNLKLTDIIAETLVTNCTSGNIRLEDVTAEFFDLKTQSGYIRALNIAGAGKILCRSGNVRLDFNQLTGDLRVEEKSGQIKVAFPTETAYQFDVTSKTGRVLLPKNAKITDYKKGQTLGQVGQLPANTITLSTVNGNIKLQ